MDKANGLVLTVVLVGLVGLYFAMAALPVPQMGSAPPVAAPMPAQEQAFIAIIERYAADYAAGANDMAKGATRLARKAAIAAYTDSTPADAPWVGTVSLLSSTNSGKGVIAIKIADNITVATTNNEFSDALEPKHTLIEPGTQLHSEAVGLQVGQTVRFTGEFVPSETDEYREISLTQEGSMMEPEFEMVFSQILPADQ